jgi:hypothetical protein
MRPAPRVTCLVEELARIAVRRGRARLFSFVEVRASSTLGRARDGLFNPVGEKLRITGDLRALLFAGRAPPAPFDLAEVGSSLSVLSASTGPQPTVASARRM